MLFYVEKWMRFIDFASAYTNLISRVVSGTNRQGNKGEIVFSHHAVIPVLVNGGEIPPGGANVSLVHIYNPLWIKKKVRVIVLTQLPIA